ncbi:MAG TPA: LEA type 2 family protein [Steroidobacteraceae bacterium]|nr:LEA type 2 family protein [Steroidobacteraceae bacterium]
MGSDALCFQRPGRRHLLRPAVALAALLAAGCAPHLERPDLSVVGVTLLGSSVWEQHLRVRLHVHNPNDRALPVRGISYDMEVMGQAAASGQSEASFVVPARGDAEFDMSVTTNLAAALLQLMARGPNTLQEEVPYRLSGKVELSQGLLRSIPFDQRGTFRLQ